MKKVNITYEPGWVLENFAKQLQQRLPYVVLQKPLKDFSINYFMPYYLLKRGPWKAGAWFTHEEEAPELKEKFRAGVKAADFCIVQAKQYISTVKGYGNKNVKQIVPGVSLDRYKPKIVLGHVGRMYTSTNRKNPAMLKFVSELPYVELKCTDGKIKEKHLPAFYNSLDAVFIPSTIEGGPMCLYEGLACGKPIIAPFGVGAVNEYVKGIIGYVKNDKKSAAKAIRRLLLERKELRQQVADHTWDRFASEHDKVFRKFV